MTTKSIPDNAANPWVVPLCWLAIALEGFDLVVIGVVLPSLLREPSWGLNPNTGALLQTVGLIGVMIGALASGAISDRLGRRKALIGTVILFTVVTLACAFAQDPVTFGVLRVLAGLGLGGVLPVGLAVVNEEARSGRASSATTTMMTGYHVGAVVCALTGRLLLSAYGWRWMFVVGAVIGVLLIPLLLWRLPESRAYRRERAARTNPVSVLFEPGYRRATVAFWVASIMGLLLVYGLNTWLPEIMVRAGYGLDVSLVLLLVLNVGAVIGLLVAGQVANRIGTRTAAMGWFVASAVFLALLAVRLPGAGIYVTVLLAGIFTFSSQVLVYAYVGQRYPDTARATALGASTGVGRIGAITGPQVVAPLVAAGIAYPWGFFLFAAVAAVGAVAVTAAGRTRAAEPLPA